MRLANAGFIATTTSSSTRDVPGTRLVDIGGLPQRAVVAEIETYRRSLVRRSSEDAASD